MAKKSRKKKAERSDFAKVRLKVGRRLPKNLNETRISLATGKILVRDQRLSLEPDLEQPEQQDQPDQHLPQQPRLLLRKLRSSQLSERVSAATKLARWLASPSTTLEAARRLFAFTELAEYLAPCLRDVRSSELRLTSAKIFSGLLERGRLAELPVFRTVLFQSIRACWSHLDSAIQSEAVALLTSLMVNAPAACCRPDDLAPRIRRLFASRLQRSRSLAKSALPSESAFSSSTTANSSLTMRRRSERLALAKCAGLFAGLLADAAVLERQEEDRRKRQDCGSAVADSLSAEFDINEAAWSERRSDWLADRAALVTLDSGPDCAQLGMAEFAEDCAGNSDDPDPESESTASLEFETGLAYLIKELLPADFAGRVGGSAAFGELLALLRCLRNLLALHCWGSGVTGCGCSAQQQQPSSQAKRSAVSKQANPCTIAVIDLLSGTLCSQFPLTVLSSAPSAQLTASATKSQRRSRAKDSLRDAAARGKELNLLVVECALICAPQLEASFGQLSSSNASTAAQPFVLAVYRFLAAAYPAKITAEDSAFWLRAGCHLVLQHPGSQLARLLLAFFTDSMASGRFEAPLPVASFLTEVACLSMQRRMRLPLPLLDDLPRRLVEQFDSAQLHLRVNSGQVAEAEVSVANSAVRCLLELASRDFPGAGAALAAASDRLVRYCPDSVLRRSLSAVLGLAVY